MSESSNISLSASRPFSHPLKQKRVLACVRCQQRKIKCERKFPCAQCNTVREQCVPATRSQNVRRRRRFPERELLERIRKYEDLLRQNNISFEPLHKDQAVKKSLEVQDNGGSEPVVPDWLSPSIVGPEGGYEVKSLLHSLTSEYASMESDSDSSEDHQIRDFLDKRGWENFFSNNDHYVFGSPNTNFDTSALHPESAHILKLWQIYLDNVDPLLKVTHTSSLQRQVIDAANNITRIKPAFEALLFSIYCVALQSIAVDDEIEAIFWGFKIGSFDKISFWLPENPYKLWVLQSRDRDCLTALFLYLVSINDKIGPWSTSSMLGIAIRIAQRMAIHSESALAKCTIFEAELRRRLWWALVLFDARISEISGHKCTTLDPTWDCRIPLSLNDSELRPEMKEPPNIQKTPTDSLFVVVRSELGDFIRHARFHLEFTNPALKPIISNTQDDTNSEKTKLDTLQKTIEDKYFNSCNLEIPMAPPATSLVFDLLSDRGSARDSRFLLSEMLEYDTKIVTSPFTCGFTWMPNLYFPFIAYMQLLVYLRKRPTGKQPEKAWEIMSTNYEAHINTPIGPFVEPLIKMVLFAWKAREATLQQPLIPPKIISLIKQKETERRQVLKMADTETEKDSFGDGANDFTMPIPRDYDGHSLLHGIEGEEEYRTSDSGSYYLNVCEQSLLDFDILRQFGWAEWDVGNNAATGSDEFASF